jgi:hypothetical protein
MNRMPSRWSVSCWSARASSSEPSMVTGSPCMSKPLATTDSARRQSNDSSGIDRQPSGPNCSSSDRSSTGLTRWAVSPSTCQVNTRQSHADLRRRQPRAGRVEHGVGEVLDELAQLLVEVDHLDRALTQHRVAEETDGLDHPGSLRAGRFVCGAAGSSRRPAADECQRVGGSTWMRTASSLRAERSRCSSPSAGTARRPWRAGPGPRPRLPVGRRHRAEHLGPSGGAAG